MKKFLPKSFNNPQGFTLVELLVVISIIAILSVIGITVFGNVQVRGRDSRRGIDIDAIAKAMEVAKGDAVTYPALTGSQFSNGIIPTDPTAASTGGRNYCFVTAAAGTVLAANPANWTSAACPTSWTSITSTAGITAAAQWKVCASFEVTTASPNVICRSNQQ